MTPDTYIEPARARVRAEQDAVDAKCDAFEAFIERVKEISMDRPAAPSVGASTVAGIQQHSTRTTDSGCREVLTAFADTVRTHSVENANTDESLLETVRAEFTESIAVALAPTTEASFTHELKETIIAETETRRAEATRSSTKSLAGSFDPRSHLYRRPDSMHSNFATRRLMLTGAAVTHSYSADRSSSRKRRITVSKPGSVTDNSCRIYTMNSRSITRCWRRSHSLMRPAKRTNEPCAIT